jgi:hypothetical protein
VLVLGALSREKGADTLEAVAAGMAGREIEFHLLGYAYRALEGGVITHGPYRNSEVYGLVEAIAPDVVWYPAQWPETYSYTLSIALHCGLPVVVPDIGAFPERVAERAASVVLPWDKSLPDLLAFWQAVLDSRDLPQLAGPGRAATVADEQALDFYQGDYLRPVVANSTVLDGGILDDLVDNYRASRAGLSRSERLLRRIWQFSRSPLVARCVALIPFGLKQSFKRRLSSRPMHDIVHKE